MTKEQKQLFRALKEAMKHGAIYKIDDATVTYSYKGKKYTVAARYEPRAHDISLVAVDEHGSALEKPTKKTIFRRVINRIDSIADLKQNFCKVTVTDYSEPKSKPQTIEYRGLADFRLMLCRLRYGKRM